MIAKTKQISAALPAEFDQYARDYEKQLPFIALTGETGDYFARARIRFLSRCLGDDRRDFRSILDFGCGTGSATPGLAEFFPGCAIVGVDVSTASLEIAREKNGLSDATFMPVDDFTPAGKMDLAVCNGVFHHIPIKDRLASVRYMYDALKPGGLFALWENNPWNPLMLYGMKHTELDRNAIPVSAPQARALVSEAGFEVLRTDFLFIFPRPLAWFRPLEHAVTSVPVGAQYQVLVRK